MSDVRQQSFVGEIKKCPSCGAEVKSFSAFCSECGHEFRAKDGASGVQEFAKKLQELQRINDTRQIIFLIQTFPIPNTKEELMEFLILASSNIDEDHLAIRGRKAKSEEAKTNKAISKAWVTKYEQAYKKAKIILASTPEFANIEMFHAEIKKILG